MLTNALGSWPRTRWCCSMTSRRVARRKRFSASMGRRIGSSGRERTGGERAHELGRDAQAHDVPRCGILVTGEEIPSGHSLRARMLVIEIKPGDVNTAMLSALQARTTQLLSEAISGFVAWLANQDKNAFTVHQRELRARAIGTHARTPEDIAVIQLGVETALRFAVEVGALTPAAAENHKEQSWKALGTLTSAQDHLLNSEGPVQRFLDLDPFV